jgi:hypothetical protein
MRAPRRALGLAHLSILKLIPSPRCCEIIPERAKTSHAKAQRRKENKAIILCDLCGFAPWRETGYFFTASHAQGCAMCCHSASAAKAGAEEALANGVFVRDFRSSRTYFGRHMLRWHFAGGNPVASECDILEEPAGDHGHHVYGLATRTSGDPGGRATPHYHRMALSGRILEARANRNQQTVSECAVARPQRVEPTPKLAFLDRPFPHLE